MKIFLAVPSAPLLCLRAACSALVLPQLELLSQREETPGSCKRRGRHFSKGRTINCPTLTSTGPTPLDPGHRQCPPISAGSGQGVEGRGELPASAEGPCLPLQRRWRLARGSLPKAACPRQRREPRAEPPPGSLSAALGKGKTKNDRGGEVAARLWGAGR